MAEAPLLLPQGIDSEVFFRDFLSADPTYRAVMVVLDRLRQPMGELTGRRTLPLSELIDMTSVEYGQDGRVVPREERLLRALAQAMRQVDITRETLRAAAGAALTDEQISEGPTSIKVPLTLIEDPDAFRCFVSSLDPAYHQCRDLPDLMRVVHGLRLHQKPLFLLIGGSGAILAYFSPAWSLCEMIEGLLLRADQRLLEIYNAKVPISGFCAQTQACPDGHLKAIYLGRRRSDGWTRQA